MAWQPYGLDRKAQVLVLAAKQRDKDSLNQAFKMRTTAAYGLERFWGEQLRLKGKEQTKSDYWKETWDALVDILNHPDHPTGIVLPNNNNIADPQKMAEQLWSLELDDQRLALAVLTQLCDCIIWWTQRYK